MSSFFYFFLFSQSGGGDEIVFINDLIYIRTNGWIESVQKSISIPYMILAYPLSLFFKDYLALRLVNILLILVLFFYFFKITKIKSSIFYFYLLFYLATVPIFFIGTNDALFFMGLIVFMNEVFCFSQKGKMNNQIIAFLGLIISFFTRELFVVYLPVVLLGFYFLYKNGFVFYRKNLILLTLFFLVINIPSLNVNHKFSYDDKSPPSEMGVSWSQRQYLAQLLVNEGVIRNFSHPSWEQTVEYLQKNGPESLPNGVFQCLIFDYSLTIKEFFKDFYYSMFYGFRQLALILLMPFYFVFINLKKRNYLAPNLYIPYSMILMILIFSLIIISFVELRWHTTVFMMSIVFYSQHQDQKIITDRVISINYFFMFCFSLYGMYGLVLKLINR